MTYVTSQGMAEHVECSVSGLNEQHFRQYIVQPVLRLMENVSGKPFNTAEAEDLLVGTALQESQLKYLGQLGGGPAVGLYQIEPAAANEVLAYLEDKPDLRVLAEELGLGKPGHIQWELTCNLALATMFARLYYWMDPEPLPEFNDVEGYARYWKRRWNTEKGKGTVKQFMENYLREK